MADAVLNVLTADGFEGVSVRKVATVAGVSIGAVQHHFPTKDAMLSAALDRAGKQFQRRLTERVREDMTPGQRLAELAVTLVSADDREISVAWLLRLARAAVDDATAERHRKDWGAMETRLREAISAAAPDVEPHTAAIELLALLDGLAISVAVEPQRVSAKIAEAIVREHVSRLIG